MLEVRRWWVPVLLLLAVAACSRNSERIEGPTPVLSDLQPRALCIEQGERQLTLTGDGLAPPA